jgi:two-component system sensor histidine kinase UhpB
VHIASEQAGTTEPVDDHDDTAALSSGSAAPSPLAVIASPDAPRRTTTRPYIPLFWRVLALNAAVVTTMAVAIAIVLPAPFAHIASDDAAILAVTLVVTLIANALLLRNALAPLTHLPALLRRVDPLQSGERLEIPSAPSEAAELAHAYNVMLDQLEGERLQSTRRALSAQESERLRVAQELHDEVGQTLTGILLSLARISKTAPPELSAQLKQLLETTRASIDEVRRIAQRLRPEPLEDLGLTGALLALSRRLREHSDLRIHTRIAEDLASQSPERELVVYRVAQEAMTNAIRHAHAASISIALQASSDCLTLSVRDDGRGMRGELREGGGMRGMRERTSLVGGSLHITSAPRAGTEVRLEIPLDGEITWLR